MGTINTTGHPGTKYLDELKRIHEKNIHSGQYMMDNPLKRSLAMELNLLKEGFTILRGCALKKLPLYSITIDSLGT